MHAVNKVTNTAKFACECCKETYSTIAAAEACEKSHAEKSCDHKNCSFTGMLDGRDIKVRRTCLKCGHTTDRVKTFEALSFWPLMEDTP